MSEERKEQLRQAGIKKHGSEEAWREFMRKSGAKASRPGTGGFHHMKLNNPSRLKEISKDAVQTRIAKQNATKG
jgi:hypothetical protein